MEGLGKGGLEGWRGETEKIDGVTKWRVGGDKMGGLGGRTGNRGLEGAGLEG